MPLYLRSALASPSPGTFLFLQYALLSPPPALTAPFFLATVFATAAQPPPPKQVSLTEKSSFLAAGGATPTNFILRRTSTVSYNFLPFFIGPLLHLTLPSPLGLQVRYDLARVWARVGVSNPA